MKALTTTLLSACIAWSAGAATDSRITKSAHAVVTAMDHCSEQGKISLFGVFACWHAKKLLTPRLRHFFEAEETWQYREFLESMQGTSALNWDDPKAVRILESLQSDPKAPRYFRVHLKQIRLTLKCDADLSNCLLDGFEWPFNFAELYCTSPLPVMKDFHVSILRNPALERVAEQVFEQPGALHDGEPARTPVTRRWDLENRRAKYLAPDFQLEVDLPEELGNPELVEGQLKSFAIYGDAVPLECQWRD